MAKQSKKTIVKKTDPKDDPTPKKKRISIEREKFLLTQLFTRNFSITDRTVIITGSIPHDGTLFSWFDACMTVLEQKNRQTIIVKINSHGGSVYEAGAIVGRINASKCKVITEGYGAVMSAATLILASGDRRKISKYSWCMHHEGSNVLIGSVSELNDQLIQAKREEDVWAQWMAELTKKDKQYWLKQGVRTDLYLSADEAIEVGIADEVI